MILEKEYTNLLNVKNVLDIPEFKPIVEMCKKHLINRTEENEKSNKEILKE